MIQKCSSSKIRKERFSKPELCVSLADLLKIERTHESSKRHTKLIESKMIKPEPVNKMNKVGITSMSSQRNPNWLSLRDKNQAIMVQKEIQRYVTTVEEIGHMTRSAQPRVKFVQSVISPITSLLIARLRISKEICV